MVAVGLLIGLAFGLLSGGLFQILVLQNLVFGALAFLLPIVQPLAALFPVPATPIWLSVVIGFVLWLAFNVLVFWILAVFAQRSLVFPGPGLDLVNNTAMQSFYRGFGAGTATLVNFVIYFPLPNPVFTILAFVSLVPFLLPIPAIRHTRFYQGIIGWMSWVMPVSWIDNARGLFFFLFWAMPAGIAAFGTGAIRFDPTSGSIETRYPMPNPTRRAFNIGVFTFLNGSNPAVAPTGFLTPGTSAHEVGHGLNTSGLTAFWAIATGIEESRVFGGPNIRALGQMTAESRAPRLGGTRLYIDLWSP